MFVVLDLSQNLQLYSGKQKVRSLVNTRSNYNIFSVYQIFISWYN